MFQSFLSFVVFSGFLFICTAGTCTWPTVFQSSIWLDSDRGTLTFNTTHVTGWGITYQTSSFDEWECYHVNDSSSSTFNMILRSTGTFQLFSITITPFVCLQITQVTQYSYAYYQQSIEEQRLNYDRVVLYGDYLLSQNMLPTETDLCSPSTGPTVNEYHLLVKKDQTNAVVQNCSSDYFGNYSYSLTDSGGTNYCGTGTEVWNVCTNYEQMTFDYTACSTEVAYSSSGTVACVYSVTSGGNVLQTVLNQDIILDADSYRFTCLMSTLNSDGSLTVSQTPGSCTKTQVPGSIPTLSNGTAVGFTLALTPRTNGLCPITTTSTSTSTTTTTEGPDNTLSYVGIGLMVALCFLILLVLGIFLIGHFCCNEEKKHS